MRRRQFLGVLGSAAAWPVAARAQQPTIPVVGFLHSGSSGSLAYLAAAFRKGLSEMGYVENQNVAIEYRWAENKTDRLPELVNELLSRPVAVIAGNGMGSQVAKSATATVPILFVVGGDPIKAGLVSSFNRPGANVTGVTVLTNEIAPKRLALLRELIPNAALIALLTNPAGVSANSDAADFLMAAETVGQQALILNAVNERDFETLFATLVQRRASGLIVAGDPFFNSSREKLVALASRHGIPTVYEWREFAEAGGLMSYGTFITDAYRQLGVYAGRILKGTKPAELPVLQPTKFELVINLKTAKTLGLTIPPTLLARADDVIE